MEKYNVWDQAKLKRLHCTLKGTWRKNATENVINFHHHSIILGDQHQSSSSTFLVSSSLLGQVLQTIISALDENWSNQLKKTSVSSILSPTTFRNRRYLTGFKKNKISLFESPDFLMTFVSGHILREKEIRKNLIEQIELIKFLQPIKGIHLRVGCVLARG